MKDPVKIERLRALTHDEESIVVATRANLRRLWLPSCP